MFESIHLPKLTEFRVKPAISFFKLPASGYYNQLDEYKVYPILEIKSPI